MPFYPTKQSEIRPMINVLLCFNPTARYDKYAPFFPQGFTFEHGKFARALVMRRSDGQFLANTPLPSFFVTHQVRDYSENLDGRRFLYISC